MAFVFVMRLAHSFGSQLFLRRGFLLILESKGAIHQGRFSKGLRTCSLHWSQDLGFFISFVLLWSFTKTFLGPPPVLSLCCWTGAICYYKSSQFPLPPPSLMNSLVVFTFCIYPLHTRSDLWDFWFCGFSFSEPISFFNQVVWFYVWIFKSNWGGAGVVDLSREKKSSHTIVVYKLHPLPFLPSVQVLLDSVDPCFYSNLIICKVLFIHSFIHWDPIMSLIFFSSWWSFCLEQVSVSNLLHLINLYSSPSLQDNPYPSNKSICF